jgi:L-asparaginase
MMGTEAIEEAAYLFDLTLDAAKPVAFTGAMSAGAAVPADGPRNVVAACRVVLEPALKDCGVLVVMGDEAHAAREAVKTHTTSLAAFRSPRSGPVALVTPDDRVVPIARPTRREQLPVGGIEERVAYVKCGLGTDGSPVEAAVARGARGLVIEGFPGGGVPPAVGEAAAAAVVAGVVVVVVPRAASGELTEIYAGVGEGRWLREHGLLFAHGLTGPKARIKLMLALGAAGSEAMPNVFGTE